MPGKFMRKIKHIFSLKSLKRCPSVLGSLRIVQIIYFYVIGIVYTSNNGQWCGQGEAKGAIPPSVVFFLFWFYIINIIDYK